MTSHKLPRLGALAQAAGDAYVHCLCRLVDASRRSSGWLLLVTAVLTGGSLYFVATHFRINSNTSDLLSRNLPFQRLNVEFDRLFPNLSQNIVVVVDGQTGGIARETSARLVHWFDEHPELFKDVYQPAGGEFFSRNGLLYLDPKALEELSDRLSQAQPLIARLSQEPNLVGLFTLLGQALDRQSSHGGSLPGLSDVIQEITRAIQALTSEAFYQVHWERLMFGAARSSQERRQLILVKPRPDTSSTQPLQKAIAATRHAVRTLGLAHTPGVRVRLTGDAVLDNNQLQTASSGMAFATLLSLALIVVLLLLGLRNLRLVLATLLTLCIGLIWTAAFALAAVGPFNLISITFAVLFVGIGVDFGIQFCMRYREEFSNTQHLSQALRSSARHMGGALSLAAIAAAASFYSFVPTSYAGIIDLGIISGTSMLIALFANLTVLPALLKLLRIHPGTSTIPKRLGFAPQLLRRSAWGITVGAVLAALAAIPLVTRADFDFDPMHLQDPNSEAVKTFRSLLAESDRSPYTIEVVEPNLVAAQHLARRVSQLQSVAQTVTLASFVPDDQAEKLNIIQRMAIIIPPFTLIPQTSTQPPTPSALRAALGKFQTQLARWRPAGEQTGLITSISDLQRAINGFQARFNATPGKIEELQERIIGTLPAELDHLGRALQAHKITLADLPPELRDRYLSTDGHARLQIFSNLDLNQIPALRQFVTQVRNVAPNAIGAPIMLKEGGDAVINAFREASAIAAGTIIVLLLVVLRNPWDTLLALAPLGLAGLLTVGTMEVFDISFNLANIIVLPLLVGLGVAYGIYYVLRWRSGEHIGKVLLSSTPAAILFSALTTMSSFGSLALAPDPGVSMLGRTLSIALSWVLVCTLIVLPAVLTLVSHEPRGDSSQA